jgi:hypothetical protein
MTLKTAERVEERRMGLALGHLLLAPATAVWTGILCGFLLQTPSLFGEIVSLQRGGHGSLRRATPAAGFYVGAALIVPMLLPLVGSWAAAFGFWKRRPWARRLAAGLSVTCGIGVLNGIFWTILDSFGSRYALERTLPPGLLVLAAVALPWCGYVLAHVRPSRRAARGMPSRAGRRRLLLGLLAVTMVAAWHLPIYFRIERRSQMYVLWRDDQAYVCAGRVRSGGRATLGSVVATFLGYAPLVLAGRRQRHDVVVVEIGGGIHRRTEVVDFPSSTALGAPVEHPGGQCYVREGRLHYDARTTRPAVWRWAATAFERIPDEDWLRMRDARPYGTGSDEGWQVDFFSEPGHRLAIQVEGTTAVLRLDGDTAVGGRQKFDGPERVLLQVGGGPEEPVLVVDRDPKWISRGEYLALSANR